MAATATRFDPSSCPALPGGPASTGIGALAVETRSAAASTAGRCDTIRAPAPVARTAATVGTAAVVVHGVNRRSDRREDRRDRR